MKRFMIVFFLIPFGIFAQDLIKNPAPNNRLESWLINKDAISPMEIGRIDFRDKIVYFNTDEFDYDEFLYYFNYIHVGRVISRDQGTDLWENLPAPHIGRIERLLFLGRHSATSPAANFTIQVVCSDRYGILLFHWYEGPNKGMTLMDRYFFELKN
jgi:hypothetical protein